RDIRCRARPPADGRRSADRPEFPPEFVMASSSNDSGLKITIAIMTTIALSSLIWGFMSHRDKTELTQKLNVATNEVSDAKGQASNLQTTNTEMLTTIGGPAAWTESKESLMKAMQVQGIGNAKQTVMATLDGQR